MYLGAEKAGIRLRDYRTALFRVGELMFDDSSFGTPKGKTNELFSVLFHRRFAAPQRCYSETTAFPADRLSAANMAAKLVVSTLADVRHTMFMSGLTPFPREHWDVLAPAMRRQADLHDMTSANPFPEMNPFFEHRIELDPPLPLDRGSSDQPSRAELQRLMRGDGRPAPVGARPGTRFARTGAGASFSTPGISRQLVESYPVAAVIFFDRALSLPEVV